MENIEADRKAIAGQAFNDVDVFILPTAKTTVPTVKNAGGNSQALSAEITAFANYYGLPAMSVPCGFDLNGLPVGVQLVGKPGGERAVLNVAYHYQTAAKNASRHPVA
jgi:aspartyl-tRNA(Asn)/glutamyl-tRNA(Gln) amidotransferase subunit A